MNARVWALGLAAIAAVAGAQDRQLEAGNTLKITCAQSPMLCVTRTIDGSGTLSLPGLGDVVAVDMSLQRFEERLTAILSAKLGKRVQVSVEPYLMANDPVKVQGYVEQPVSRSYNPRLTIMDMLRDTALRKDADDADVTVYRESGRKLEVNLDGGDCPAQPGDIIEVHPISSASMVMLFGPVLNPGGFRCTPGLTLKEAIRRAGGLAGHADASHILLRRAGQPERVLDLRDDGDMRLQRGDAIAIGLTTVRLWVSISGPVAHPGLVEFRPGMTLTQAIREAGGDLQKLPDAVTLTHIRDKHMRTSHLHLKRILAKMDLDPSLQAADSIDLGGR